MSVDVRDFVIDKSDMSGWYRLSAQVEAMNERDRQKLERDRKEALGISEYYDKALSDKDNFTGIPQLDPNIRSLLIDAKAVVASMNKKRAGFENIQAALTPIVSQISNYQQKAAAYSAYKKEYLAQADKIKGSNTSALSSKLDKEMFSNPDGSMKNIKDVDISKFDQIAADTILKYGDEVTDDKGFAEFANQFKPTSYKAKIKETDKKGASQTKEYNITAPEWTTVDDEGKIVPRYTEAGQVDEEGNKVPHTFDFKTKEGTKTATVRMLDEQTFEHLVDSNPFIHARIQAKVKKAGFDGDLRSDIKAKNAARAIAYDELKTYAWGTTQAVQEDKAAPSPKTIIHISTGKYKDDQQKIDIWKGLQTKTNGGTLTNTESALIKKVGNDATGASEGSNAYGIRDNNGQIEVYAKDDIVIEKNPTTGKAIRTVKKGQALSVLSEEDVATYANKELGIKSKAPAVKDVQDKNKVLTFEEWKSKNKSGTFAEYMKYKNTTK